MTHVAGPVPVLSTKSVLLFPYVACDDVSMARGSSYYLYMPS